MITAGHPGEQPGSCCPFRWPASSCRPADDVSMPVIRGRPAAGWVGYAPDHQSAGPVAANGAEKGALSSAPVHRRGTHDPNQTSTARGPANSRLPCRPAGPGHGRGVGDRAGLVHRAGVRHDGHDRHGPADVASNATPRPASPTAGTTGTRSASSTARTTPARRLRRVRRRPGARRAPTTPRRPRPASTRSTWWSRSGSPRRRAPCNARWRALHRPPGHHRPVRGPGRGHGQPGAAPAQPHRGHRQRGHREWWNVDVVGVKSLSAWNKIVHAKSSWDLAYLQRTSAPTSPGTSRPTCSCTSPSSVSTPVPGRPPPRRPGPPPAANQRQKGEHRS